MNRVFISLYLDEDVDVLIARLIQARAFVAMTAQDAGQLGRSDAEQLQFASDHGMSILTHNRADFEQLARQYITADERHDGIFIASRRSPDGVARRLLVLMNQITADEMENQVLYI